MHIGDPHRAQQGTGVQQRPAGCWEPVLLMVNREGWGGTPPHSLCVSVSLGKGVCSKAEFKCQFLGPVLHILDSVGLDWDPGISISNKAQKLPLPQMILIQVILGPHTLENLAPKGGLA